MTKKNETTTVQAVETIEKKVDNIHIVMNRIQKSLVVVKGERNEFGRYNYRTAEGILTAVKAAMPENATINLSDEILDFGGRIFLKAVVTFAIGTDPIQMLQSTSYAEVDRHKGMSLDQCVGCASSYARKYALCGLFGISDKREDPDSMDNGGNDIDGIRRMVAMCNTLDGLLNLWNGLNGWQDNDDVRNIFGNRKQELNAQ